MTVAPGDVLAVRSGGWAGRLIRFGAALRDQPNLDNHIAVVHHADAHGTTWCVEGRPGGVGWRDARDYLASPWTITNAAQPKTDGQRRAVCQVMEAMLGTPYDWEAIAADVLADVAGRLAPLWAPTWDGAVPGHVVCSSAAAWAYAAAQLPAPAGGRECQPSDWTVFVQTQGWITGGRDDSA